MRADSETVEGGEMKRGTPNHPKVQVFAELIRRRRPEAIGYLELLFHFTAQYAPDGAIGRYDDKRIAAGIDWMGRPSQVIDALVAAGWLDRHPTARLVVHDWGDHADRATLQRLARVGKIPIQQIHKVTEKVCAQSETKKNTLCSEETHLPVPEPEPEPEPEPHFDTDLSDIAFAIWQRHPKHRRGTLQECERSLVGVVATAVDPAALAASIDRRHAGWCASEEWTERGGKFCPGLSRWFSDGGCMREPPELESPDDWAADLIRREAEGRA